jgi:hypothetical protein
MKIRETRIAQHARYLAADICIPLMRLTGFRFSKAWRGNPVIEHVYANVKADGFKVQKLIF